MSKEYFVARESGGNRALLVQARVFQSDHYVEFQEALSEFKALVSSASMTIIEVVTANLTTPHPKYFIGEGKAHDIAEIVRTLEIEVVFFNHALSPAQSRNLEQLFQCLVSDRSALILHIFAQRARTYEGKLQVELAQLEHLRTRLVRGWTHLERQKGGIGLRGPGETQLETDRRLIDARIKHIKKRLEKVVTQRGQSRRARQRSKTALIALVGYTNVGKSALFNRLTESSVYVADQLFATLDPTLRYMHLPVVGEIVLADTVGFIRQLPHELIAAFKATLEETRQADLLLHVIDASVENSVQVIADVNSILNEIGANDMPVLQVMNKIDLSDQLQPRIDYDAEKQPRRVWISAETGLGLDLLQQAIVTLLTKRIVRAQVTLQSDQGRLRAKLYQLGVVRSEKIDDNGCWLLDLEIQQLDFERLLKQP